MTLECMSSDVQAQPPYSSTRDELLNTSKKCVKNLQDPSRNQARMLAQPLHTVGPGGLYASGCMALMLTRMPGSLLL